MGLKEKAAALAAAAKQLPAEVEASIDAATAQIASVRARKDQVFGDLASTVNDVNAAVAATADAVNQLTNGAPK
jgi:uncharacterized hydantoinase/oxoprolinase family protein